MKILILALFELGNIMIDEKAVLSIWKFSSDHFLSKYLSSLELLESKRPPCT